MKVERTTVTLAFWLVALCVVGLVAGVTSVAGWIILGGLALLPPIFMLRLRREPPQSMSESIHEARR